MEQQQQPDAGRYIAERLWRDGEYPNEYYDAIDAAARAVKLCPSVSFGEAVFAASYGSAHGENLWDDLGGDPADWDTFNRDPEIEFGPAALFALADKHAPEWRDGLTIELLPDWSVSIAACNAMLKGACDRAEAANPKLRAKWIHIEPQGNDDDRTAEQIHADIRASMKARGSDAYRQFLHEEIERAAFNIKLGLLTGDEPWQVAARARLRADVRELNAL